MAGDANTGWGQSLMGLNGFNRMGLRVGGVVRQADDMSTGKVEIETGR